MCNYTEWGTGIDTTNSDFLNFDGSQYITCGNDTVRNLSDQLTLQAWIRTTKDTSEIGIVAGNYDGSNGAFLGVRDGLVTIEGRSGVDPTWKWSGFSQTNVSDGEWHLITGVVDANDTWSIYVDGVLEESQDFSISTVELESDNTLLIGNYYTGTNRMFYGDIKQVALWNEAKTSCEVLDNYKGEHPVGNEANLVAYFPLNEGSGQVATDLSNVGLNGTLGATTGSESSDPTWVNEDDISTGVSTFENHLSFYGNEEAHGGTDSRSITNNVTVEAWVKTTYMDKQVPVTKYDFPNGYFLFINNGKAAFEGRSGNDGVYKGSGFSSTVIADDEWHHIVGVADVNDTWKIYVDGVLESSTDFSNATVSLDNSGPLYLGRGTASFNYKYRGDLKHVSVWNVAKTDAEITADYNLENPTGTETNLVAYFPLNQECGQVVNDLSNSSVNGVLGTSSALESSDPSWNSVETIRNGITSTTTNYLSFDGVNDYVGSDTNNRGITNEVTLEAWINTTTNSSSSKLFLSKYPHLSATLNGYFLLLKDGKVAIHGRVHPNYLQSGYSGFIADGEWHHIVGTVSSDNTWSIYVDGVLAADSTYSGNVATLKNTAYLAISANKREDGNVYYYNAGKLKEISVWNKAKTVSEIYYDYRKETLNGTEANLVAYFPLNEGSGTTATDLSLTGINGTITGATWQSETIIDTNLIGLDSIRVPNRASVNFGERLYDSRVVRIPTIDPLHAKYPYYSPYSFAGNMGVNAIDADGLEPIVVNGKVVGYRVEAGQGPSQIAADLNNPATQKKFGYTLQKTVDYKDIVTQNKETFEKKGNFESKDWINNPNDGGYTRLNINKGETLIFRQHKESIANECILLKKKLGPATVRQGINPPSPPSYWPEGWNEEREKEFEKYREDIRNTGKEVETWGEVESWAENERRVRDMFENLFPQDYSGDNTVGSDDGPPTGGSDHVTPPIIYPYERKSKKTFEAYDGEMLIETSTIWKRKGEDSDSMRSTLVNENGDTISDYKHNYKTGETKRLK